MNSEVIKKSKNFHPFLIAMFPIMIIYSQNIGKIDVAELILPIILILGASIIIYYFFKKILNNTNKAAIITTVIFSYYFVSVICTYNVYRYRVNYN